MVAAVMTAGAVALSLTAAEAVRVVVPVMEVARVRVRVRHGLVIVPVAVAQRCGLAGMDVIVVSVVVSMAVHVRRGGMRVRMRVPIGDDERAYLARVLAEVGLLPATSAASAPTPAPALARS